MDGLLRFQLDSDGAVDTLHVAGELDIATAPELEHAVDAGLDGRSGEFRLDLSGLTFVDSTGAQALLMRPTPSSHAVDDSSWWPRSARYEEPSRSWDSAKSSTSEVIGMISPSSRFTLAFCADGRSTSTSRGP